MGIRGVSSGGGGASALNDLTDVIITAPALADVLRYDGIDWVNVSSTSDWLSQYLLLAGRTGGQVIGAGAHTGGGSTDIAIEGRLLLGDALSGVNYTTGRMLDVRINARNATSQINVQYIGAGFTGTASGTWRGLQLTLSGTGGWTGGTVAALQGFFFTNTIIVPSGVTVTDLLGGLFQSSPQETNSGSTGINNSTGLRVIALGPSIANALHKANSIIGLDIQIGNRAKEVATVFGAEVSQNTASSNKIDDWIMYGVRSTFTFNQNINTALYGLLLDPTIGGTGTIAKKYGLFVSDAFDRSVIAQPTTIGAQVDPIHTLDSQGNLGVKVSAYKIAAYGPAAETVIPCNANAGAFAINLPTAVGISGRVYIIKKTDATANAVTVTPNGAETIDGAATVVLNAQWQFTRVISDGANWLII